MFNKSVLDVNSTSVPFNFCFNGVYVGIIIGYVAVSLGFFLGTPAHSWLLWLYLRDGWKIKPSQVFPLNMTILELIFSLDSAVEVLNMLIFSNGTVWKMLFFFISLTWVGRPLIQICISIERYLAVIHPIMFMKYKGLQYRIAFAAVVWLMVVAFALYEAFAETFADYIFNSVFFISVIIISFCCVSVLRALKHPGPGDTQIPVERGRDVGNQQKRKAFNTIFTGLFIILFAYLPQTSLSFIPVMQVDRTLFRCNFVPIMNAFNVLGIMITPFLKMYKKGCMKCF